VIPISRPALGEEEQKAVAQTLESGMLAQGPRVAEFQRAFAEFIGVRHAIATTSGTTALHAALLAHGIGPGDEVITTSFTFIASVNAILYTGARPVFVDIDASYNLDAQQIEGAIRDRTKAILPVHLYGQAADMQIITDLARRHHLALVEDACQAHGALYDGRPVGSFGTGCFSFYATKNMTTGEGGMITTDDDAVAERVRRLINHGMKTRYYHDELGYNYRMTDIAAAIGLEQLKKLPALNAQRLENARYFDMHLAGTPRLTLPRIFPRRNHVYHQYTVRIAAAGNSTRDQVAEGLRSQGVGTGIYYPVPVHLQKSMASFGWKEGSFPVAECVAKEVLSIPVHPRLSDAERAQVAKCLLELLR
jgi:perosamine synthetase